MLSSLTGGGGMSSSVASGVTSSTSYDTNSGNITMGDFFTNGNKSESNQTMVIGGLIAATLLGLVWIKKSK